MTRISLPLHRGLRALYLLPLVCLGLGLQAQTVFAPQDKANAEVSPQDPPKKLTSNAEYVAYMQSLREEYSEMVEEWNSVIPPHNRLAMKLEKEAKEHPEISDSLLAIAAREREIAKALMPDRQARMDGNQALRNALEKEYELVFEDAFPYFRRRDRISKDSLSVILKKASPEIRNSPVGKALLKHIKTRQLAEGERFRTVRCYSVDGKPFDWRRTQGKKVFLVHDGLWCMTHGQDNTLFRKYLEFLAEKAPDCFPLIVVNCKTPEELQAAIDEYGLHAFAVVSEFKGDVGKLNWLYGDQTTPTCHYINENGILQKRTERIDQDYLEKEFLKIK